MSDFFVKYIKSQKKNRKSIDFDVKRIYNRDYQYYISKTM